MKRKRGQRSGHKKESKETEPEQLISSDSEPEPEPETEHEPEPEPETETDEMEVEPHPEPKSTNKITPKPEPSRPPVGQVVYSRVRVKIKSPASLPVEPYQTSSDKGNEQRQPQLAREDSGLSDLKNTKFGNFFSRKFGGIKIKTNKSLTPPSASVSGDMESNVASELAGGSERRNEAELNSALTVIRKIMKMEAAAPFNEPVDPVALGIPDYFDVIDTPMDFSTICKEIGQGHKYMNSEDVYKDVKLIWQNCYKYNNKGDYIIDLMRRVKKNFSKYWGAAGLSVSTDNSQTEEAGQSGQEKALSKSKLKNKKKKRSTMDHKSDCMCAVCTIRRRKLEKENPSMADTPTVNLEEKSASEAGASSMDHSPGPDTEHISRRDDNTPIKETDNQLCSDNSNKGNAKFGNNQALKLQLSGNEGSDESGPTSDEELEYKKKNDNDINNASSQPKETYNKIQPPKKNEVLMENHIALELCKSVFNNGLMSRRSLARQAVPVRDSPIQSAVASLLKR
ncbi:hypothetical protein LUZ63_003070 [Rhynchospora breviuscula]|uniref:Bromo domain-containing protein n=1 Tax=Rhynchospora breviuscula TaxID=2022672 RepID=A0A9Q0CZY1_9POAL|nr:hypothetical protein LUZ63_003070 [Rhynchospora breviuscula]